MKTGILFGTLLLAGATAFFALKQFQPATTATPQAAPKPAIDINALRAKAEAGDAAAQAQLGRLYAKGEGVTTSYAEAAAWFKRAAEQGNAEGQFGLGELYDAGQGVKADPAEAVQLYRRAADQGHVGAQYTLGFLYESGRAVSQDQVQATKWYRLAAEQGDRLSQFDLGQRYEIGVGVAIDKVEALKWFMLAAAQGQSDSVARAKRIKDNMSSEQVAEAKRRVASFSPRPGLKP